MLRMGLDSKPLSFRRGITEKVIQSGLKKVKLEFDMKYYEELYSQINSETSKTKSKKRLTTLKQRLAPREHFARIATPANALSYFLQQTTNNKQLTS